MKKGGNIYKKIVFVLGLIIAINFNVFSQVSSDFDHRVDFSKYKTYDFIPGTNMNPEQANSNQLDQEINNAVAAQLNARGLRQSSNNPDLLITFTSGVIKQAGIENTNPAYAGPGFDVASETEGWWTASLNKWRNNWWVNTNSEKTLIIDLKDAANNELVYRIYGMDKDKKPSKRQEELNKIAEKGFKDFPR